MNQLENQEQLDLLKREKDAVLILFGGAHCGVCQTIKPQIDEKFSLKFPNLEMVYIDCEQLQEVCAQHGVQCKGVEEYGQRYLTNQAMNRLENLAYRSHFLCQWYRYFLWGRNLLKR